MSCMSKNEIALRVQMHAEKQELRNRIQRDPQLKKDFDLLIEKTGWQPHQLITGLCLDCNLMSADRQTLLRNEKLEWWPISEDTLRRNIKNIRRIAGQIQAINQTKGLSPTRNRSVGDNFVGLPEMLSSYAEELERIVNISAHYWKRKRSLIPGIVLLTRENSLYERVRSSTGQYHQTRLLRLLNLTREIRGYQNISQRAFTIWLNRFEKQRKKEEC
jgi:hypothetical protein